MTDSGIIAEHLTKTYKGKKRTLITAVNDISFTVPIDNHKNAYRDSFTGFRYHFHKWHEL